MIFPNERTFKCEFDEDNNLIREIFPSGKIYKYKYDENNKKEKS